MRSDYSICVLIHYSSETNDYSMKANCSEVYSPFIQWWYSFSHCYWWYSILFDDDTLIWLSDTIVTTFSLWYSMMIQVFDEIQADVTISVINYSDSDLMLMQWYTMTLWVPLLRCWYSIFIVDTSGDEPVLMQWLLLMHYLPSLLHYEVSDTFSDGDDAFCNGQLVMALSAKCLCNVSIIQ